VVNSVCSKESGKNNIKRVHVVNSVCSKESGNESGKKRVGRRASVVKSYLKGLGSRVLGFRV